MNIDGIDLTQFLKGGNVLIVILLGVVAYLIKRNNGGSTPAPAPSDPSKPQPQPNDPFSPLPGNPGHQVLNMILNLLSKFLGFGIAKTASTDPLNAKLDQAHDDAALAGLASVLAKNPEAAKKLKDLL